MCEQADGGALWVLEPALEVTNCSHTELCLFRQLRLREAARATMPLQGIRKGKCSVHRTCPRNAILLRWPTRRQPELHSDRADVVTEVYRNGNVRPQPWM